MECYSRVQSGDDIREGWESAGIAREFRSMGQAEKPILTETTTYYVRSYL